MAKHLYSTIQLAGIALIVTALVNPWNLLHNPWIRCPLILFLTSTAIMHGEAKAQDEILKHISSEQENPDKL
ncbi:hypothetical protein Cylst_6447 (plasmid) [Cylindrospermum stagnale PCC 7417]|uniref:Uncharacterized protein n=1 Tax=Cylindrospermum stagnale PCC 7417 TaxID=56107 RepID=K9X6W9_9NOST|nr:hypothetical protein Cylst_6447 [Cylindrospermum stagnale PCC 7417]